MLEAEGAGHAATAGVQQFHIGAGAAEDVHFVGHLHGRFVVAVAVEDDFAAGVLRGKEVRCVADEELAEQQRLVDAERKQKERDEWDRVKAEEQAEQQRLADAARKQKEKDEWDRVQAEEQAEQQRLSDVERKLKEREEWDRIKAEEQAEQQRLADVERKQKERNEWDRVKAEEQAVQHQVAEVYADRKPYVSPSRVPEHNSPVLAADTKLASEVIESSQERLVNGDHSPTADSSFVAEDETWYDAGDEPPPISAAINGRFGGQHHSGLIIQPSALTTDDSVADFMDAVSDPRVAPQPTISTHCTPLPLALYTQADLDECFTTSFQSSFYSDLSTIAMVPLYDSNPTTSTTSSAKVIAVSSEYTSELYQSYLNHSEALIASSHKRDTDHYLTLINNTNSTNNGKATNSTTSSAKVGAVGKVQQQDSNYSNGVKAVEGEGGESKACDLLNDREDDCI